LAQQKTQIVEPHNFRNISFDDLLQPPNVDDDVIKRSQADLAAYIKTQKQRETQAVIFAEENMIGAMRRNLREHRLYTDATLRLSRFATVIGGDVRRIGLAIRDYEGYWSSVLAFSILRGHRFLNYDVCDGLIAQPRRWRDLITDIAVAFPNAQLQVWQFKDFASAPHSILENLTGLAAQETETIDLAGIHNAAPDRDALRDALIARGRLPNVIAPGSTHWQPFTKDQVAILKAQYEEDLTWLRSGADGLATFITNTTSQDQARAMGAGPGA
jgi:hypothetical protein